MTNISTFKHENFKKSSFSAKDQVTCVGIAYNGKVIAIKNTNDPKQVPLYFNKKEWQAFVKGVKHGEFGFNIC